MACKFRFSLRTQLLLRKREYSLVLIDIRLCFILLYIINLDVFFLNRSEQTTQSTSTSTSSAQQTLQQVQIPGAPEGLTVVAQIPHDLILRESVEEQKDNAASATTTEITQVKTEAGTTPVALIKRGGVKNQGNQGGEEFIAALPANWQTIAAGSSVAEYFTRFVVFC